MLLVCLVKYGLVIQQLLDLGEQRLLLIVMVRLDELEPGQGVTDEVGLIGILNVGRLEVDGVVATEDGVVQ